MGYFLPSEIGRLVLGYLKEEHCMDSYQTFLRECVHLREYATLLRRGREFPTTIAEKSLKNILSDYGLQIDVHHRLEPVDCLWLKHDSLITQIKGRYLLSQQHPSCSAAMGNDFKHAQSCRSRKSNQINSSLPADSFVNSSTGSLPRSDVLASDERTEITLQSPPRGVEGDSDSDSHALVMEMTPVKLPVSTSTVKRKLIKRMSPNQLGGVQVDMSTGKATCLTTTTTTTTTTSASSSPCSSATATSTQPCSDQPPILDAPASAVSPNSARSVVMQENSFTNHQRNSDVKLRTLRPRAAKTALENANKMKSAAGVKSTKRSQTTRRKDSKEVASAETMEMDGDNVPELDDCHAVAETHADCITPKKTTELPATTTNLKSPRRKCPVPKRRSGCQEEMGGNPGIAPTNTNNPNATDAMLSMPLLDDLINNTHLVDKLVNTINRAKQGIDPSDPVESEAPVDTVEAAPADTSKSRKKRRVSFVAGAEADEGDWDNSLANVAFEDDARTQEVVNNIIEMTKTDPDFDVLFHLFSSDPKSTIDELEPSESTKDAMPVIQVSKLADGDSAASGDMVQVLYESPDGSTDYIETVKIGTLKKGRRAKKPKAATKVKKTKTAASKPTLTSTPTSTAAVKKSAKPRKSRAKSKKASPKKASPKKASTVDLTVIEDSKFAFKVPDPPRPEAFDENTKKPVAGVVEPKPSIGSSKRGGSRKKKLRPLGIVSKRDRVNHPNKQGLVPSTGVDALGVPGAQSVVGSVVDLGHIQIPASITLVSPSLPPHIENLVGFAPIAQPIEVYQSTGVGQQQAYLQQPDMQMMMVQRSQAQHPSLLQVPISHAQALVGGLQPAVSQQVCQGLIYQADPGTGCTSSVPFPLSQCQAAAPETIQWAVEHSYMVPATSTATSVQSKALHQQTLQQQQTALQQPDLQQQQQQPDLQQTALQQQQDAVSLTSQSLHTLQTKLPAYHTPSTVLATQPSVAKGNSGCHTPLVSSDGHTPLVSSDGHTPLVSSDGHTPLVSSGGHKPQVSSDCDTPLVSSGGHTRVGSGSHTPVSSGGHTPIDSSGSHTPIVGSGSHTSIDSSGGHTPIVGSGSHTPLVSSDSHTRIDSSGGHTPLVSSGSHTPVVSSGSHTSLVSSGSHTPLVSSSSHTPLVSSSSHTPLVSSGSHTPLVSSGGRTPLVTAGGCTPLRNSGCHTPLADSGGSTPLNDGSPFYSNVETPGLGAHEVIELNSPVAVSPYSSISASLQPHRRASTPINSKPPAQEFGSARTRYIWSHNKNRRKTLLSLTPIANVPVRGSRNQNSPVKENTTPEKQTPCTGSSTPLHTKEVQVAETMVAMAATPVKQVPVERLQHLPATSPKGSSGGQTNGADGSVFLDGTADEPASVSGEQLLRTPKKRKACQSVVVSPDRSVLLNKLIQVSTGALVNGFGEFLVDGSDVPSSAQKRPSSSSKGSKQKRLKLEKMDMDKILSKLHPS